MSESPRFWFEIDNVEQVRTPALVFYRDRIDANIASAIAIAGDPDRLRPHVKTHKCSQIVSMMLSRGIVKYKCATIDEAAMLARAGARDILVAYPPIGPTAADFVDLTRAHPDVRCRIAVANPDGADAIAAAASIPGKPASHARPIEVIVDLNVGMDRTGVAIDRALDFYRALASTGVVVPTGLHAYDGHVHDVDPAERCARTLPTVTAVRAIERALGDDGIRVETIVAGGTPTFPCYAAVAGIELSPGTFVLHDYAYVERYPDLPFEPAALVIGRVVSLPGGRRFTVDIGSKAIATDQAGSRGVILNMPDAAHVGQSEEHWVFDAPGRVPAIGTVCYVVPRHVCPTVNLHAAAHIVGASRAIEAVWPIDARRGLAGAP